METRGGNTRHTRQRSDSSLQRWGYIQLVYGHVAYGSSTKHVAVQYFYYIYAHTHIYIYIAKCIIVKTYVINLLLQVLYSGCLQWKL